MITEEEYIKWLRTATKKQVAFVNHYLKTLNTRESFIAAGYNYKNISFGKYKVFMKLLPYIQYALQKYQISITKEFLVANWLQILTTGKKSEKQNALKELAKLFNYSSEGTKVEVQNNLPNPVVIKFDEKNN